MADKIGVVILAAGEGTRMKMREPKPLIPLSGRRLIDFPIKLTEEFQKDSGQDVSLSIVTGFESEKVEKHIREKHPDSEVSFAFQRKRKGTGDALKTYFRETSHAKEMDYTLIMCADTPLLESKTLSTLYNVLCRENLDAVCASFESPSPYGYGRILRSPKGFSIVEEKDADNQQKQITEVNSGLYMMKTDYIAEHLGELNDQNASGEFYLTDLFNAERNVKALAFQDPTVFFGVNDLSQLETAGKELRKKKVKSLSDAGVRFIDSRHTYIDDTVEVEEECTIYPNVFLQGNTSVKKGALIDTGAIVRDSRVGMETEVLAYSHIEKTQIGESVRVGPFARLREGTCLDSGVHVGNFVETKKAHLHKGSKANHLSYIGDAEIGERTNIGCGFITCNFDGRDKHKTTIGKDSFIGSDCQTIAPVEIGDECFVASGSTINSEMRDGDFAISRCRQTTKEGVAKKFIKK